VMIVSIILVVILAAVFIFIMVVDKTCHTIPMMLVGNSCVSALLAACALLSFSIFTLQNDLKQIYYQDSLLSFSRVSLLCCKCLVHPFIFNTS
jgi:hypothetical protein